MGQKLKEAKEYLFGAGGGLYIYIPWMQAHLSPGVYDIVFKLVSAVVMALVCGAAGKIGGYIGSALWKWIKDILWPWIKKKFTFKKPIKKETP